MDKYELKLTFGITKQDGSPFCDGTVNYHNLAYDDLVATEGGVMVGLLKLGLANVQARNPAVAEQVKAAIGLK